jgi:acyl-CoA thioesterase
MNSSQKAIEIIHRLMLGNDAFSKWIDIKIISAGPGYCTLEAKIRQEMLNGFNICHGGVTYSIADSALAFASNSHGIKAVSVETAISHVKAVKQEDVITAKATEKHLTTKFGIYEVVLCNQDNEVVALFKGTVFLTGKEWIL